MRCHDRVALVTGGASGIGAACAAALVREGAKVWIADLNLTAATRCASMIGAQAVSLDVTSKVAWERAVTTVAEACGPISVLINAAGISGGGGAADVAAVELASWRQVFSVNVDGVLLGCQQALRSMSNGGSIVNICSIVALRPTPTLAAYGASKAALEHLTRSVASFCGMQELAIRCNMVMPGMVETPMVADMGDDYVHAWKEQIPMHRFAQPQEIADAVVFLACNESKYISGSSIVVDGGFLSRPLMNQFRS